MARVRPFHRRSARIPRGRPAAPAATGETARRVGYGPAARGLGDPARRSPPAVRLSSPAAHRLTPPRETRWSSRATSRTVEGIRADQASDGRDRRRRRRAFARLVADVSPGHAALRPVDARCRAATRRRRWCRRRWSAFGRTPTLAADRAHRHVAAPRAFRLCIDALSRRRPSVAIDDVAEIVPDGKPLPGARLCGWTTSAPYAPRSRRFLRASARPSCSAISRASTRPTGASVMGVGEHAYKSLLARARRNLRAALSNGRATP